MISGKIHGIEPKAQYQGNVFTQSVYMNISEVTVELFDGTVPIATDEMIGLEVRAKVIALPKSIDKVDAKMSKISKREDGTYELIGTVQKVPKKNSDNGQYLLPIEIDCGVINIDLEDMCIQEDIQTRDTLSVVAYRLDLVDIDSESIE